MMKKSIFIFFVAIILFQACSGDEPVPLCENCDFSCVDIDNDNVWMNNCIDNWTCDYTVTPQSRVEITELRGKSEGDKNVFQMINSTGGNPGIADDESSIVLVFELNETQNSFSVEASELERMNVHYRKFCFCSTVEFIAIHTGCMQGEKQPDGTWRIQGDLSIIHSSGTGDIKFDAQFIN